MNCCKLIGYVIVGILVLLGLAGFVVSLVDLSIIVEDEETSKSSIICSSHENEFILEEIIYSLICPGRENDEFCVELKNSAENNKNVANAYLDEYDVETCIDIWPK